MRGQVALSPSVGSEAVGTGTGGAGGFRPPVFSTGPPFPAHSPLSACGGGQLPAFSGFTLASCMFGDCKLTLLSA